MAEEVSEAFRVSYTLLHADAQLVTLVNDRIYQLQAPQRVFDLGDRYILGDFMAGSEVLGVGGARLMTEPLILWRVIKRGQLDDLLRQADNRMDFVLQNVRAQTSGGFQFSVVRERPHYRVTRDEAQNAYTEVGGQYRYYISK